MKIEDLTPEQQAQWAKDALNNPVLQNALTLAKQAYNTGAMNCDAKDDLGRFRYIQAQKVVEAVGRHLQAVIASGEMPKVEREFERKGIIPRF